MPEDLRNNFLEESQLALNESNLAQLDGIKRKFQGFTNEPLEQTVPNAPADSSYLFNIAQQVPAGAYTAVNNSIRSAEDLAGWLDDNLFGDLVTTDRIFDLPETDSIFAAPEGTVAGFTRGASQFLTGFIPILKGMRAFSQGRRLIGILGASGVKARFAQASVAGFIADYTVWDPRNPNVSSLINENIPMLANPISEYLETDLDDTASEARLKNAIEGAFLGTAAEGIFRAVRLLKANGVAKSALEGTEGGATGGAKGVDKGIAGEGIETGVENIPQVSKSLGVSKARLSKIIKGQQPQLGKLARKYQSFEGPETRTVAELFEIGNPDRQFNVNFQFSVDNITEKTINKAAKEVYEFTQWSLVRNRKLGETVKVYIGRKKAGPFSREIVGVSLDEDVAQRFAVRLKGVVESYTIPRSEILADIEALKPKGFAEAELLVRAETLQRGIGKGIAQATPTVGRALKKAPKDVVVDAVTDEGTFFSSKKTGQTYVKFKGKEGVFRVKPGAVTRKGASGLAPSDVPPKARTAPATTKGLVKETSASVKGEGVVVGDRKLFVEYDNIREGHVGLNDVDAVLDGWIKIMRKFKDPQTLAEIEAKAAKRGFVLEDIKGGFKGAADEWSVYLRAVMKMSDEAIISFKELTVKAHAGDAAARAVWAKRLALTDAIELFASGKRSDAARALWVSRINDRGNIVLWKAIRDNIDMEFDSEMTLDTGIERVIRLMDDVDNLRLGQFMKQVVRPGMWDLFIELWINSILSGPRTLFAVNPIGNISTAVTSPIERFLAGVLKPLSRTAVTGTKTTITTAGGKTQKVFLSVQKGEAVAMAMSWGNDLITLKRGAARLLGGGERTFAEIHRQEGILKNFAQGAIDIGRMVKRGFDAESRLGAKGTKVGLPTASRDVINARNIKLIISEDLGLRHLGVSSKVNAEGLFAKSIDFVGKSIRIPGKILVATDDVFKGIVHRMEMHAEAWRQATMEGYTGKAFRKRFNVLLQDTNLIKGAAKRAKAQGELRTFTNELDGWGKAIQSFSNSHPSARLIVPFVRTPINIGTYSLKRTPILNMAWKETRDAVLFGKGGLEADLVRGQFALGVTVTAGVAYLATEGIITGTGPRSSTQRGLMRQAGWQPLSVWINGKYRSFNRFDPWAITLGIVADIVHMGGKVPNKTYDELALMTVTAMARNFTAKTYLQGMSNFFEMISDPSRSGRHIRRTVASFVPFTSLLRQTESMVDPTLRETRTVLDEVYSGIVGLSDKLPPSRNLKGEPVILPPGVGPFGIIPMYVSNDSQDPVWMELMRNQAKIGMPQETIHGTQVPLIPLEEGSVKQGVLLSPEEYDEYVRLAGNELKINGKGMWDTLEWLIEQPYYDAATDGPDGGKVAFMSRTVRRYRQAARNQLLLNHPLLRDKVIELDKERFAARYGNAPTLSAPTISF